MSSVYSDSSEDSFDDPKIETITELVTRRWVCPSPSNIVRSH